MAAPQPWDCPICLRHVPAKVAECYCGYKRSEAAPGDGGGRTAPLLLAMGAAVFVIGGAAAYVLRPLPAAPANAVATPLAAATLPPSRIRSEAPTVSTVPEAWKALAIEATPTPAPAVEAPVAATPSPSPTPDDSIDAQRAKGVAALEEALSGLAARVTDFGEKLRRYNGQCVRENTQVTGCDSARAELHEVARQIAADVEVADEAARRSWVDPGQRRALRERSGLDENGVSAIVKAAAEAARR